VAWPPVGGGAVYPIVYFDALVMKVKESHQVRNKAADIAVGVDTDGIKHVLRVQITEGATCWAGCWPSSASATDVLIACYGGVTGLPGGDRGDMAAECGADLCGASDQGLDAVRRKIIIYTTNSIESLNYQLREIIKNQGHFPNARAVVKLLWLPIRDIEDKS
jgi:hypothetical protein